MSPLFILGIPILSLGLVLTAVSWLGNDNERRVTMGISLGIALIGVMLVGVGA